MAGRYYEGEGRRNRWVKPTHPKLVLLENGYLGTGLDCFDGGQSCFDGRKAYFSRYKSCSSCRDRSLDHRKRSGNGGKRSVSRGESSREEGGGRLAHEDAMRAHSTRLLDRVFCVVPSPLGHGISRKLPLGDKWPKGARIKPYQLMQISFFELVATYPWEVQMPPLYVLKAAAILA